MIENVIIESEFVRNGDAESLFADGPIHRTQTRDLPNLLKEMGVFGSTSEARRAGRVGPVPTGWSEIRASKTRRLFVWNPGA